MSPVSPCSTLPGVWEKVSQIEGPLPPSFAAPSIWYEAVAAPHKKPSGKFKPLPPLVFVVLGYRRPARLPCPAHLVSHANPGGVRHGPHGKRIVTPRS